MAKKMCIVLAALAVSFSSFAATKAPVFNGNGVMTIEAEQMTLTGGEVVEAQDASGGKAVKVLTEKTTGKIEITLPAGEYMVATYMNAPDPEHDGFYVLLDSTVVRTFATTHIVWTSGSRYIQITFKKEGTHTLTFTPSPEGQKPAEAGMLVDRFEIVTMKK